MDKKTDSEEVVDFGGMIIPVWALKQVTRDFRDTVPSIDQDILDDGNIEEETTNL